MIYCHYFFKLSITVAKMESYINYGEQRKENQIEVLTNRGNKCKMNINAENVQKNKINLDNSLQTDNNGTTNDHKNEKQESKIKSYDILQDNSSMTFNYCI